MKVTISGPAAVFDTDEHQITEAAVLQSLDGLEYAEEVCATYLDEPLNDIGLEGGSLHITFDRPSQRLRVVTEYRAPRKLKKSELASLVNFTLSQWSDGIGEGCFDDYREKMNISVSVYPIPYDEAAVQVSQIDDGTKTAKRSPLFAVAKKGDVKKLQVLLEKGEPIEAKGQWGHTPLMCAVANDQVEAALFLISHHADVNHKTKDATNCMQLATMLGNVRILTALIEAGANIDERADRGATPVMWAANRGHLDALRLLIQRGADVNALDTLSHTALMYAQPERLHVVEFLLEHGADPNLRTHDGLTASQEALQQAEWERKSPWKRLDRSELYERKAQLLKQYER
jgi:hypothetical protein